MYYIYINNLGVLKKLKPHKLYGVYRTASEANKAISKLNISQENILIKHDNKTIDYIELVEDVNKDNKNKIDCMKKLFDETQEDSYMKLKQYIDMFAKKEELSKLEKNLTYYVAEHETNEDIFTIYVGDNKVSVKLSDNEKFIELIDDNEIFKFEFYSLKSVRKIINTETLNKEEIYKTLTSIFHKSIEENIINIMEG